MDQSTWEDIDPQLDEIADEIERILASDDAKKLRELLATLSQTVVEDVSVDLNCMVSIFDRDREKSLSLVNVGLGVSESGEVYPTSGDSSAHRYVVDGEIEVVPNDICPKCYHDWGFKFENPKCAYCDAELGVNCWALLDSDVCPNCDDGEISASNPKCKSCGYAVDPKFVKWG
jgi:hypothetical protein